MKKSTADEEHPLHSRHPRLSAVLHGHGAAEAMLLDQWNKKTLPGAYLFAGPRGIGKATLAYRFARFLLSQENCRPERSEGPNAVKIGPSPTAQDDVDLFGNPVPVILAISSLATPPDSPVFQRIAAGTHSGLLTIEPAWDPRKKAYKSEIVAEDARKVGAFLSLTAGEGGWRVVLIDAADQLNTHAANAILKWLEEPPPGALFLLVAHNPGAVLPTIRSRCRMLHLQAPDAAAFDAILAETLPDADAEARRLLYTLASGSPGLAVTLHEQGAIEIHTVLLALLRALPEYDVTALFSLADKAAGVASPLAFEQLSHLLRGLMARLVRVAAGDETLALPPQEREALARLAASKPLEYWLEIWEKGARLLADAEGLHLDRRHTFVALLEGFAGKNQFLHHAA